MIQPTTRPTARAVTPPATEQARFCPRCGAPVVAGVYQAPTAHPTPTQQPQAVQASPQQGQATKEQQVVLDQERAALESYMAAHDGNVPRP
jgi:hypothetical protein